MSLTDQYYVSSYQSSGRSSLDFIPTNIILRPKRPPEEASETVHHVSVGPQSNFIAYSLTLITALLVVGLVGYFVFKKFRK